MSSSAVALIFWFFLIPETESRYRGCQNDSVRNPLGVLKSLRRTIHDNGTTYFIANGEGLNHDVGPVLQRKSNWPILIDAGVPAFQAADVRGLEFLRHTYSCGVSQWSGSAS